MINYKRILDFLTEYGGKEYKAPEEIIRGWKEKKWNNKKRRTACSNWIKKR